MEALEEVDGPGKRKGPTIQGKSHKSNSKSDKETKWNHVLHAKVTRISHCSRLQE